MDDLSFDVVVVGCGISGLSAAVMAQQNGARVAILERAPKDERGGNTRYTESLWRMKTVDAVSEDDPRVIHLGDNLQPVAIGNRALDQVRARGWAGPGLSDEVDEVAGRGPGQLQFGFVALVD